jgi:RNA polymerase sigma factor (sigma-70 family)
MMNAPIAKDRLFHEGEAIKKFLESPNEESFVDLFQIFTPQIVAFFRSRGCEIASSEDLAQEVMLTVYRKARQIRHRALFRAWLFKIARNALCRHYGKQSRGVETIDLGNIADRLLAASNRPTANIGIAPHASA